MPHSITLFQRTCQIYAYHTRNLSCRHRNSCSQVFMPPTATPSLTRKKNHKLYLTTIHGPCPLQHMLLLSLLSQKPAVLDFIRGPRHYKQRLQPWPYVTAANALYRRPCSALQINSETLCCPLFDFYQCYYRTREMSTTFCGKIHA